MGRAGACTKGSDGRGKRVAGVVGLAVAVALAAPLLTSCSSAPTAADYRLDAGAGALMPTDIDGRPAAPDAMSDAVAAQLQSLAPDITTVKGVSVAASDANQPNQTSGISLFALEGKQNALNLVEQRVASAMGEGRPQSKFTPEANDDTGGSWKYSEEQLTIGGLAASKVATVSSTGEPIEAWILIRPKGNILIAARDVAGNPDALKQSVEAMLEKARA